MEEKNYERTRNVLTKGVKEWVDNEFVTNPRKSWDSIQKTAYEIWNYLELDGSGSFLNKKPNGEPIFYLNANDPNKLLEIGPNKTVGSVAVSLEGQLIAACKRRNVKCEEVPAKSSRHSHKPSEIVWYKVEFDSVLNHIDYMWFTKYTDEGCPEKGKPFFRNAKGNLSNWPRGLTSSMKENEEIERTKKAEKEKEKRDKKKEIEEWIKGCGDGTGTKEGFTLCGKHSQLVEEIKAEYPKCVDNNDTGFIERTVKQRIEEAKKSEEVNQTPRDNVPETESVEEDFLKTLEGIVEVLGFAQKKPDKKYHGMYYLKLKDGEGNRRDRSLRTKNKVEATKLHKKALKICGGRATVRPEPEPESIEAMKTMKTMETTEQESSAWNWMSGLFGKSEQAEAFDEPNEELNETVWVEPSEPEPMREVLYNVRDANGALIKANDRILEITETLELKAKAKAFDELELTLVPHHIAEVEARLAEIERERKELMKELGNNV